MSKEPFDYKVEFDRLMIVVRAAGELGIDIDRLVEEHRRAETLGPILDPTKYVWGGGARNLEEQGLVLAFAAPFVRKAQALVAAAEGATAGGHTPDCALARWRVGGPLRPRPSLGEPPCSCGLAQLVRTAKAGGGENGAPE